MSRRAAGWSTPAAPSICGSRPARKRAPYAGIVRLVREAESSQAPFVRLAHRNAPWFVGLTMATAGVAWAAGGSGRAVAVLVVATPCPLIWPRRGPGGGPVAGRPAGHRQVGSSVRSPDQFWLIPAALKSRPIRSGTGRRRWPGASTSAAGADRAGPPTPGQPMEASTVFFDTRSPTSGSSSRTRGDP